MIMNRTPMAVGASCAALIFIGISGCSSATDPEPSSSPSVTQVLPPSRPSLPNSSSPFTGAPAPPAAPSPATPSVPKRVYPKEINGTPVVIGDTLAVAKQRLTESGYTVGEIRKIASSKPKNVVITQTGEDGMKDIPIILVISTGKR